MMKSKFPFKFIVILALLAFATVFSWKSFFSQYVQHDTVSIHNFPMQIGGWTAEEMLIPERDLAILETKNAFTRKYSKPSGESIILFIVYSQTNRKVAHPPEICYTGGGLSILSNNLVTLKDTGTADSLQAHRMFVESGQYQQIANYFFKVGDSLTANYYKQQFLIAVKTLLQQNASSAMVRIQTEVEANNIPPADERIREFTFTILPLLSEYLP